jgi:hypothetical protein
MLYHSLFQKTALNQLKESLETQGMRKDIIKRRSNMNLNFSSMGSNFDISNYSQPVLIGITDMKRLIKIAECNMAFISKVMVPKGSVINQDLMNFCPLKLQHYYRKQIIDILKTGDDAFMSLILIYRGYNGHWRSQNVEVKILNRVGGLVQFAILFQ